MRKLLALAALAALPTVAQAADAPILSLSRFSFAAGANQVFVAEQPSYFELGLYSAYNLTPHLSLSHSTQYVPSADGSQFVHRVGVRLRLSVSQ